MKLNKEVAEALKKQDESKLYHALYDIYDIGSAEACEAFEKWKIAMNTHEKNMMNKAIQKIYENESFIANVF